MLKNGYQDMASIFSHAIVAAALGTALLPVKAPAADDTLVKSSGR